MLCVTPTTTATSHGTVTLRHDGSSGAVVGVDVVVVVVVVVDVVVVGG